MKKTFCTLFRHLDREIKSKMLISGRRLSIIFNTLAFLFWSKLLFVFNCYNDDGAFAAKVYYGAIDNRKGDKYVALTFDDGPHGTLTPRLLAALKQKNVVVTFFVMGIKVEMHPEIVAAALQDGHEIGNHVFDHPVLSKLSFQDVHDQLNRTNHAILKATNSTPSIMRPPYGNTNKKLNAYITDQEKLDVIMWSLDTNDWRRPSPAAIVSRATKKLQPGTVILCHDIHPGTIEAVPLIIDEAHKQGYKFLTVSQLIRGLGTG